MIKLRLTAVGNAAGVVFIREVMARRKVRKGGTVYLTEFSGGYRLTPYSLDIHSWAATSPPASWSLNCSWT